MIVKKEKTLQIRDPIHGTLQLSRREVAVVDHPAFQRLRLIKQLGLADLAYPGATHTRYAHGLGTQHVATRMLQSLLRHFELEAADARRLTQTLRLAALFHDLGHAPLSHTTERFMPPVSALDLGPWAPAEERRATHEDYTLAIVTRSSLAELIRQRFADDGVTPEDVAAIIAGHALAGPERFVVGGLDWLPLLLQCVSSELDADRMDYLLRDSYYAGVPYGRYDHEWLLENLLPVEQDHRLYLGLDARAGFGFEDYLLSRHHMFLAVYLNHIPIAYEAMLARYHEDAPHELEIPADVDAYLSCDDVFLLHRLRTSKSEWARRMVERRAYRMVLEVRQDPTGGAGLSAAVDLPPRGLPEPEDVKDSLQAAGIPALVHTVKGSVSKYFNPGGSQPPAAAGAPDLFMVEAGHPFPVEEYVPLYRRYAGAVRLARVYVDPERVDDAKAVLRRG
jgi:HD superfamily phosphohydrolase